MEYFVENRFVDACAAALPLSDALITRNYACFEYTRTYGGKPFMLERHLTRFAQTLAKMEISLPQTLDEIRDLVLTLIERNGFSESGIKLVATGGDVKDVVPEGPGRLLILVNEYKPFPKTFYENGIALRSTKHMRAYPDLKTTFYMPGVFAQRDAYASGDDEAIYVSADGNVLECPTSNIFGVKNGALITPEKDVLKGVTRDLVIEIAQKKMAVEERALPLSELLTCDEIFITSTNREIMPAKSIDGNLLGPFPITRLLMSEFYNLFSHPAKEHYMHGVERPPVAHT